MLDEGSAHGYYCARLLRAQGEPALREALELARDPASGVGATAAASIAMALAAEGLAEEAQAWLLHARAILPPADAAAARAAAAPAPAPAPGAAGSAAPSAPASAALHFQ
jgi:hypothetical protein